VFVLLLAFGGLVLVATHYPALLWRLDLVRQKVGGEHVGLSWVAVGVRMFPRSWAVRRFIDPGLDHWVKKLDYPLEQQTTWKVYDLFEGKTSCLDFFDTHFSILRGGNRPHELHQHPEEEIIIPISGEVDILRAKDETGADHTTERIGYGRFVYHAPHQFHTISAVGPEPSSYLIFKWRSTASKAGNDAALPSSTFEFDTSRLAQADGGFQMRLLFESPTVYLYKLHCHYSRLQPGQAMSRTTTRMM
jgi:hypothetical protein